MEAFVLIAALLIVVAVPQLIANKYFPRERVSVKTELKKKKVIVDHPFKVTYTAVSSTENIIDIIPPQINGVAVIDGPSYTIKTNSRQTVEYELKAIKEGLIHFEPAAVLLENDQLYQSKESEILILNVTNPKSNE
ncbi:MAG TPA: hypothetical protein DCR48_13995 [Flavobacteriales bacterium]|nr:hypothetical protein [Flavobacteriales bacterium]